MIKDNVFEDTLDIILAEQRLASLKNKNIISMEEFEREFSVDFDSVEAIDDEEIE